MVIFGIQSRKVCGCFELKYVILFMMLISCVWTRDNIPSFNVTCNSAGLYVKIAFSKPFDGVVYAKGHRFDPLCSMAESSVLEGSLALPLMACGTHVQETNYAWITNTIVIQQHPLIRTVNDLEKSIICSLPHPLVYFWDPAFQLDQIYDSHSLSPTEFSSDIQLRSDVFHEDSATTFDYSFTRLTIFQLSNGTIYNDVGIKSCIAHNSGVLAGNSSIQQIINSEGCFTVDSENSGLTIIETDKGLTAYVEMKNLEMESSDSFYLTCEVILCKNKCKCSEIDQQTKHVISHKLTKRSTDINSETFSAKKYEARTRFLKSTVKALMDRIVEQRKQNDKTKVRKRLVRLDDSPFLSEINSFGSRAVIASTEIFSPEPVSTEFYNIEPHLVDVYDDYDHEDSHQDYDPDDSEHENSHQHYDPDSHNYKEESSPTTRSSMVDSDIVVTSSREFRADDTEIVFNEKLQGNGTAVLSDVVSSDKEVTENINTADSTISGVSAEVEVASDHLDSCVPRIRFVIVIVVLGFCIGCLLLVSCGMILYIRKEKKRNRLNDFLLYSIGF